MPLRKFGDELSIARIVIRKKDANFLAFHVYYGISLRSNETKVWSIVLIILTSLRLSPHGYDMATTSDTISHFVTQEQ